MFKSDFIIFSLSRWLSDFYPPLVRWCRGLTDVVGPCVCTTCVDSFCVCVGVWVLACAALYVQCVVFCLHQLFLWWEHTRLLSYNSGDSWTLIQICTGWLALFITTNPTTVVYFDHRLSCSHKHTPNVCWNWSAVSRCPIPDLQFELKTTNPSCWLYLLYK